MSQAVLDEFPEIDGIPFSFPEPGALESIFSELNCWCVDVDCFGFE